MQNRFSDPATGATYDWHTNHNPTGEELTGKNRAIARTPNTSTTGVVLTQGDDGSYSIRLSGQMDMRAQLRAFWHWYELTKTQSIYFRDFDGQVFEVIIDTLQTKRVGKLGPSGRDPSVPHHYWEYTIGMTVIDFISGDMADMGVTP